MKEQALKQLHALHLPAPIGTWPLAYGWYILITLFLFILTTVLVNIYKYIKFRKPKRLALKKLAKLEKIYSTEQDANKMAYQITVLLKQVCFAYYPRQKVASLHGEKWHKFLGDNDWSKILIKLNYQKASDEDLSLIFSPIRIWIKNCDKQTKVS